MVLHLGGRSSGGSSSTTVSSNSRQKLPPHTGLRPSNAAAVGAGSTADLGAASLHGPAVSWGWTGDSRANTKNGTRWTQVVIFRGGSLLPPLRSPDRSPSPVPSFLVNHQTGS